MVQLIVRAYQGGTVRVAFGAPILGRELLARGATPSAIAEAVGAAARRLIEDPPSGWRTLLKASPAS